MPRRKADILALPGVGPALGEILLAVFNSWEADSEARAAAAPKNDTAIHAANVSKDAEENGDCTGVDDVHVEQHLRNATGTRFVGGGGAGVDGCSRGSADRVEDDSNACRVEVVVGDEDCAIVGVSQTGNRTVGASAAAHAVKGGGGDT